MKNFLTALTAQQQQDEDHPLIRVAYALGVTILVLGTAMPHGERWTTCGIALIAFSYVY
jgi:hypothetical protein